MKEQPQLKKKTCKDNKIKNENIYIKKITISEKKVTSQSSVPNGEKTSYESNFERP